MIRRGLAYELIEEALTLRGDARALEALASLLPLADACLLKQYVSPAVQLAKSVPAEHRVSLQSALGSVADGQLTRVLEELDRESQDARRRRVRN